MLRGYRSIVVAVAGLALLAAAPAPNEGGNANKSQPAPAGDRALERTAGPPAKQSEPDEYQAPCRDGEYDNRSDLCAQWYAARAARDAANWAWWSLFVGIVGAVGIVFALVLTVESNRIARDTARRQLRAYLDFDNITLGLATDQRPAAEGTKRARIAIKVHNFGQTPAYKVALAYELFMEIGEKRTPATKEGRTVVPIEYVAPTDHATQHTDFDAPESHWAALDQNRFRMIACVTASYEDAFANEHTLSSEFRNEGIGQMNFIQGTRKAT